MNFNYWRDIFDKKDLETINFIRNDGIHILIDLNGHTSHNRLSIFPSRPAPIQLTWLGCNISTGIPEIDYIISDKYAYKNEQKKFFVEKFWNMPQVLQCLSKDNLDLIHQETPATKNQFVTFGSFNNTAKLNDRVIQIWSKILKNVENSKIFLKNYLLEDKEIKQTLIKKFKDNGISENRIVIKKKTESRKDSLEMYNKIDIALDTFPYNGVTTSHEAILMGVPVLTKKGERPHSKMGESLNSNINMTKWIAKDDKDYIYKAIKFSKNIPKLSEIRKELIRQAQLTSSFDCNIFADQFEKEIWKIWNKFYNDKINK
jgi:predicted O-linked N-acetylglucosamine transferase (SPINDLY family)